MLTPERLRALRIAMGWSPDQLATFLGVSRRQYYRYESPGGKLHPHTAALLILVADVVSRTRTQRIDRVVAYWETQGIDPELSRTNCAMGLEGAESAVPADWQPEKLSPCPVVLPVDLSPLIPRRTVAS